MEEVVIDDFDQFEGQSSPKKGKGVSDSIVYEDEGEQ